MNAECDIMLTVVKSTNTLTFKQCCFLYEKHVAQKEIGFNLKQTLCFLGVCPFQKGRHRFFVSKNCQQQFLRLRCLSFQKNLLI